MAKTAHNVARKQRVKKILERAKGAWGDRSKRYRQARITVLRAMAYHYRDRKINKRRFRALWILRINAFCRAHGAKYSTFIAGLKKQKIDISRDVLADMAVHEPEAMKELLDLALKA